jgi:hypothetical protein
VFYQLEIDWIFPGSIAVMINNSYSYSCKQNATFKVAQLKVAITTIYFSGFSGGVGIPSRDAKPTHK